MNNQNTSDKALELLSEGKFDELIRICESIDIHDSQLLEYYAIAECYQGNLEKSKEIFLKAINLDPHNTNLLYNYSEILSDLGSHASTKEVLAKILSLEPEHNAARTKLENLIYILKINYKNQFQIYL